MKGILGHRWVQVCVFIVGAGAFQGCGGGDTPSGEPAEKASAPGKAKKQAKGAKDGAKSAKKTGNKKKGAGAAQSAKPPAESGDVVQDTIAALKSYGDAVSPKAPEIPYPDHTGLLNCFTTSLCPNAYRQARSQCQTVQHHFPNKTCMFYR